MGHAIPLCNTRLGVSPYTHDKPRRAIESELSHPPKRHGYVLHTQLHVFLRGSHQEKQREMESLLFGRSPGLQARFILHNTAVCL